MQLLAQRLEVPLDTLRASISRPTAQRRPRGSPRRQPSSASDERATASPFVRMDRDPLEEYCLTLLIRHPDLAEQADALSPQLFLRPENRELFASYLSVGCDSGEGETDDESALVAAPPLIQEQMASLRQRPLLPMDLAKRRRAFDDVVARLEERSLRQQKKDEHDRFADSPDAMNEEDHRSAVEINERLKQNQEARSRPRS